MTGTFHLLSQCPGGTKTAKTRLNPIFQKSSSQILPSSDLHFTFSVSRPFYYNLSGKSFSVALILVNYSFACKTCSYFRESSIDFYKACSGKEVCEGVPLSILSKVIWEHAGQLDLTASAWSNLTNLLPVLTVGTSQLHYIILVSKTG